MKPITQLTEKDARKRMFFIIDQNITQSGSKTDVEGKKHWEG